ncbi:ATP synthase subunit b 1 [Bienertia sinuspersici]
MWCCHIVVDVLAYMAKERGGWEADLLDRGRGKQTYIAADVGGAQGNRPAVDAGGRETDLLLCTGLGDLVGRLAGGVMAWWVGLVGRLVGGECSGGQADVRGQRPSREELEAELNSTKKQNQILEDRMGAIQDENNQLKGRIGSVES